MSKLKIDIPIIVEGKYDKIKIDSIIDGNIIKVNGFGIFKSEQTKEYIKKLAEKNGIIVFTDSDSGGLVIRNYLKSILPKEKIFHIYPPQIEGKEKRKSSPSKEGYLGVEGIPANIICELFTPFINQKNNHTQKKLITKTDLFEDGISGGPNSKALRSKLLSSLNLPQNLSTNALTDALNFLYSYEEYKAILIKVKEGEK